MRAKGIVSLSLALALCATPALAQSPANVIQLDFKADVQADGVPANIQPDASLAPPLQAMVRKRVAEWRYRMGTWQGKPVPAPVSQRIVAEVMPVASGGFALRIKEVSFPVVTVVRKDIDRTLTRMPPPVYPAALLQRGVGGVLVYAYGVDASGRPRDIELVHPQDPDRDFKLLDAAGRATMARWTLEPTKVGGVQVDCRVLTPMTFSVDRAPPKGPDLDAYRASHPEACPGPPRLLTEVAGSLL